MGICLDTEQNNEDVESSSGETRGNTGFARGRASPVTAAFPMQNTSHVKFEPPSVPVVFVLGGPGSGKVTHCDTLMQERRGVVHINMTDLLQQYAIGNDMQDFGTLSSKTVTEVLMLEMKMAPTARTYLVSGYPRSMRDVAEYSDKIQTINGVILVSWRQRILERQIEYGARLGHVVLSLARMELGNFYKRVMPVADYFDQSNMLVSINGERNPEEVYKDFRAAVLQILGNAEADGTFNGVPGEIVGVEPAPTALPKTLRTEEAATSIGLVPPVPPSLPAMLPRTEVRAHTPAKLDTPKTEIIRVRGALTIPPTVFVIGGPGSNKASMCQRVVSQRHGWIHYSLGQRLRALADVGGGPRTDGALVRTSISGGEFSPSSIVSKLVRGAVADASSSGQGLLLDGYPRDLEQLESFQRDYHMQPRMVLVDCSKLQLGRGRRDDSVAAFRRRLELFRELTLPMLKAIDSQHRLVIVDGDTDTPEVQEDFAKILLEEMEKAEIIAQIPRPADHQQTRLDKNMTATQQLAHSMVRMGGSIANGAINTGLRNGNIPNGGLPNGVANGFVGNNKNKIKPSINTSTKVPTVSELTPEDIRRMYEQSSGEITLNSHI